jgi:hypothetical protein
VQIKAALGIGLSLIALAAAAVLSRAPLSVLRANYAITHTELVRTTEPAYACQTHEVLPSGTSAIRLGLTTVLGPRVVVSVLVDGRPVTEGSHSPGWEGASVTVPVRPLNRRLAGAEVCVHLSLLNGPVAMLGWHTPLAVAAVGGGKHLPGRMHIEYLHTGRQSWWSMATSVAHRLGLGRAASGTWNALLVMALATALVALSSWLLVRELR